MRKWPELPANSPIRKMMTQPVIFRQYAILTENPHMSVRELRKIPLPDAKNVCDEFARKFSGVTRGQFIEPAKKKIQEVEEKFVMANKEIIDFLIRAKKATYAGRGAETVSTRPQSHDLTYGEGDYMYYDTYLGGANFAGEEAVWLAGSPYWSMNYAGRVTGENFSGDFLKEALFNVPSEMPFRGPSEYSSGDYIYKCSVRGEFEWFCGYETISFRGQVIYECNFHGCIIK